ncbi:MAG: TIGR03943 family protein [Chloroflexota bacterium]
MEHTHDHHHHDHEHRDDHGHDDRMEWAKALVLIGLSAYFIFNLISGNVTNYINARFIWLSYLAGGLFLLYGGYMLYTLIQARRGNPIEHEHDHDHDHEHATWGILAIVAFPIAIGFFSTSTPLGADAVNGGVSQNAVGGENGMTISSDDPMKWHVLDWLRAFGQSEDITEFEGQEASFIGFIYREPDYGTNTVMVTRFTVNCCVADASAIGLPVRGEMVADVEQGLWVRVTGAYEISNFRGENTPVLVPQQVELIEMPDPPYIYP